MANHPPPSVSWAVLVILTVALATGAAASILIGATTAPPPPPGPASLVDLPFSVLGYIGLAFLVGVVVSLVFWRLSSTTNPATTRAVVSVLVVILLGVLFVFAARVIGFGGPVSFGGGSLSSGNSSSTPPNTTTSSGAGLNGSGGQIYLFPSLPAWLPFALLIAVILVVVVVAVPLTRRYLAERREGAAPRKAVPVTVPPGVREALVQASTELDLGGDPRMVILALYGELLLRLQPVVGGVETNTPEEIRATHLVRLQVRPKAANTLTRLFEEARYSAHPMGAKESERAREALRDALADLDRRVPGQ